jgi:hypothetical protein
MPAPGPLSGLTHQRRPASGQGVRAAGPMRAGSCDGSAERPARQRFALPAILYPDPGEPHSPHHDRGMV